MPANSWTTARKKARVGFCQMAVSPGGVLDKHNQLHRDAAIQEGDVILSVNGVHGDLDAMLAQIVEEDSVVFEVERGEVLWAQNKEYE